jgi:pimeloyl-ACP methyl ester carboxylesterase
VVADTGAVLASLASDRCYVAGWSGGGPHALACAAALPGVLATLVMAGVAPHDAEGLDWLAGMGQSNLDEFAAADGGEAPLRAFLEAEELAEVTAADILESFGSLLPPVDMAVLTDELGGDLAAGIRFGLRPGIDGWLDDDVAFVAPWGFDIASIEPPVSLWQGSAT